MAIEHNSVALKAHILRLSKSKVWGKAVEEWKFTGISMHETNCPCGVRIMENCWLHNTVTNEITFVGNVCVKMFTRHNTANIFDNLKKIIDDRSMAVTRDTIDYCEEQGWLTPWEVTFYTDTFRKRKLSLKQYNVRNQINDKIVARFKTANHRMKAKLTYASR